MAQFTKGLVNKMSAVFDSQQNQQPTPPSKKRELDDGKDGSAQCSNPPVFKLDLVNCLAEVCETQNTHTNELFEKHATQTQESTKLLLAEHVAQQQKFTQDTLGKFAEQVTAKFATQDSRIEYLENRANTDQNNLEEIKGRLAACEANQAKQAQLLQLADANGSITRAEVNFGDFDRPVNLEILRIGSPKFVSVASIQNAITPFVVGCGFPIDTWKIQGHTDGRNFSVQFLQNALTSAKNVDKCVGALKDEEGNWKTFFAETAKKNLDGTFETCKLHVGKDQNDKTRTIGFMVRMFYKAFEATHVGRKDAKYFQGSFNIVTDDKSKSRDENIHPFAKFVPTSKTMARQSVEWNLVACAEYKIDKDALMDKFLYYSSDPADRVEWCL